MLSRVVIWLIPLTGLHRPRVWHYRWRWSMTDAPAPLAVELASCITSPCAPPWAEMYTIAWPRSKKANKPSTLVYGAKGRPEMAPFGQHFRAPFQCSRSTQPRNLRSLENPKHPDAAFSWSQYCLGQHHFYGLRRSTKMRSVFGYWFSRGSLRLAPRRAPEHCSSNLVTREGLPTQYECTMDNARKWKEQGAWYMPLERKQVEQLAHTASWKVAFSLLQLKMLE